MEIRPIRNDTDHEAALREIESLWEAKLGTREHDRLEVLSILVSHYEAEHHPVEPLDPITALKTFVAERNLSCKDLESILGLDTA